MNTNFSKQLIAFSLVFAATATPFVCAMEASSSSSSREPSFSALKKFLNDFCGYKYKCVHTFLGCFHEKSVSKELIEHIKNPYQCKEVLERICNAALKDFSSLNSNVRYHARCVIEALIERGLPKDSMNAIRDVAITNSSLSHSDMRYDAKRIIEALIEKGIPEASIKIIHDAALTNLSSPDANVRYHAQCIIDALKKKDSIK